MSPTVTKRSLGLADKIKRALRSRELGKKHYERSDTLLQEIALEMEPGQTIKIRWLADDMNVTLVDQFAGANIVWNPCAARRWSLKVKAA